MKQKPLGKGLRALIAETDTVMESTGLTSDIEISRIKPNPQQPRQNFDAKGLEELKQSIVTSGLLQPILVRRHGQNYQIVVGERRWRASQDAGLERIPARVVEVDSDEEMLELALLENVQREDLNPIELAEAFRHLQISCQLTQEEISKKVGKSRAHVANILRLLKLPDEIQTSLRNGELTMGHARALLAAKDNKARMALYKRLREGDISVRTTEELVRPARSGKRSKSSGDESIDSNRRGYYRRIEERFRQHLSTRTKIRPRKQGGTIELDFYSDSDLERLVELIEGEV